MNTMTQQQPIAASAWRALVDIFAEPRSALLSLRENTNWLWLPLLLIPVVMGLYWLYYFQFVDFSWMRDEVVAQEARLRVFDQDQTEALRRQMTFSMMANSSIIATVSMTLLMMFAQALYFTLTLSLVGNHGLSFKQWLGLSSWSQMPTLLVPVTGIVGMLSATDNRILPEQLSYTSVNTMLFHLPNEHPLYSVLQWIDLAMLWSLVLLILGVRLWTRSSWFKASLTVLTPYIIVYGINIAMHY